MRSVREGSLWLERHRRILEISRLSRRLLPHAAPAAQTLLGGCSVMELAADTADFLPVSADLPAAVLAAFDQLVDRAEVVEPETGQLLAELVRFDGALAGRVAAGTLDFELDVLAYVAVLRHYSGSFAPGALLRDVPPIVARTRVEFVSRDGERVARRVPSNGR